MLAIGVILAQSALTADAQSRGMQQRRGPAVSKIKVGEFPPDFDLPILKFGENKEGKPVGIINDGETIKLSSFFGKKPVCMIMSSYT
jgi:hypothetical protein